MLPSPWILLAVGLAFASVAGWGGYQHVRASDAVGEKNLAVAAKNTALAEKAVAEGDRNRAVDANQQLQAANRELQELREKERKILSQLIASQDEISSNLEQALRDTNEIKETNADVKAILDATVPDALRMRLDR